MPTIHLDLNDNYDIYIEQNILSEATLIAETCKQLAPRWVIIADENLNELYAKPLQKKLQQHNNCELITFTANEKNKSREQKQILEDQLFELGCTRDTCLIALGGGVTTDLVGFVAATFCRGIPVVYCPTSLLAMVDASIGGKTGLNTPYGKNLIGSFYQPKAVFIDPLVLKTLPKELFSEGMAEAIKHALLTSQVMVDDLLNNSQAIMTLEPTVLIKMISENLKVKKHYVELDEKETAGPRKLLNLGHTVAHGIEKLSQHQVNHGQAVGLGLIAEAKMAQAMDIANQNVVDTIIKLLNAFNLPTKLQENFDQEELIAALMHDKKNSNGEIHCCFLETIGQPYIKNGRFSHAVNPELIKL